LKTLGPGLIVMAAFMGPGSVTTASVAGADYGFVVLWSVVFATVATIILQEMAARLGIVSREGLGEALRTTFRHPVVKVAMALLVLLAIGVGGFSFSTGTVTGSSQGLTIITGIPREVTIAVTYAVVFALLFVGRYKVLERVLIGLVILMSVTFVVTALMVQPDVGDMLRGLVVPSIPAGSLITLIGLIGSAVVPYNLFLHSSSVQEKWPASVPTRQALSEARTDTWFSITVGGVITAAILATGAAAFFGSGERIEDAVDMATQLEPVLGAAAEIFFGLGFMAAGLTSAITAPLAAAFATTGVLGWGRDLKSWRFRAVWVIVLTGGAVLALANADPVALIIITQYAAGLSLPVLAIFLIVVMNRRDMLGEHVNGVVSNVLGAIVVLGVSALGGLQIFGVV
ncbi:MAG: Nramp family divalent metal transporter, partial [Thermocrispum sp.]